MKHILLATALIVFPVAIFTAGEMRMSSAGAAQVGADPLGDLAPYEAIVIDTQVIAASGDLAGAKTRITDFETLWDDAEAAMRPMDTAAWGNVDSAADGALLSLRARHRDPKNVRKALSELISVLADREGTGGGAGPALLVSGIAVTDANGHPLPCETMLGRLRAALNDGSIPSADIAAATALQVKATERCNADDDTRADGFTAQALSLVAP